MFQSDTWTAERLHEMALATAYLELATEPADVVGQPSKTHDGSLFVEPPTKWKQSGNKRRTVGSWKWQHIIS